MLRTQVAVLAAKVEVTEGTAETLAGADGFLALTGEFQRNLNMLDRDPLRPTLSQLASVPGAYNSSIRTRVEGKGSGTAGTAPEFGKLLRACGFAETVSASTSVTYLPASSGEPSLTVAHYENGIRHLIAGARGNVTFGGAVGEFLAFDFDFLGVEDSITDVAIISPTFQSTVPRPLLSTSFSLHGFSAKCTSFSIDMGNTITPRQDMSKASGFISTIIGNRRPVGNFVVEKELVATKDWYGIWKAGTESTLSLVLGATAGNILTVTAPKVQIMNITEQDDGGIKKLSIDVKFNLSAGDDELSLAFT